MEMCYTNRSSGVRATKGDMLVTHLAGLVEVIEIHNFSIS